MIGFAEVKDVTFLRIDIAGKGYSRHQIERIAGILADGGLGIIPTDTVYGLASPATDAEAVKRLLRIKRRSPGKPMTVQIASHSDADRLCVADGPLARYLAAEYWPGPLTLVLPRRPGLDLPFQGPETLGLRMPDHGFCLDLIDEAGYLVVPSANLSGGAPPASPEQIPGGLLESVDFIVDGGLCREGMESTVVRLTDGCEVLREGAVPAADIMRIASAYVEGSS